MNKIRCFNCNSKNTEVFDTVVDDDLLTLKYECEDCGADGIVEYELDEIINREY